jgi:tetratricopeptide (TPR) repeat protein
LATATKSVMSESGRLQYDQGKIAEFYTGSQPAIGQASAMNWRLKTAILFAGLICDVRPADAEETAAQTLLLKGRYAEAAQWFSRDATSDPAAAIGLARCKLGTGKREDAETVLQTAAEAFPKSAAIRAELALLALNRGDHETAEKYAANAVEIDKDCVAAHWVEAERLRLTGKLAEAQTSYAWFIGFYNRAPRIDNPEDLQWIARGVAQHARWNRNSNQFQRLISEVYPAALRLSSDYWPAHLDAALLYLEKFNEADAAAEIARGLAINPQAAELHAAKAALALTRFDLAAAKLSLDRALEINPQFLQAHQLRADLLFADLRAAEAIPVLEQALKLNPRDETTLGQLLAAFIVVDGRRGGELSPRAKTIADQVQGRNPHCGDFYLAAADAFDRMRRFSLAAEYYRLANNRLPQLVSVRGQLGLVLMRLGEEAEAAKLLEESFVIDPFNVRVKNMLEVLDLLKNYAALETDHFVIRFDRGQDELLARYAASHLEAEVFPELTSKLGFTPRGKTLIEIFSRSARTSGHSWFSARMVGLPFIGTVGACAGQMVALTSPTELQGKYDWALVLRHEFVHVLNLQQTDFAVPHWLTEGLAVHLENQPRPQKWTILLASRAKEDALFNLNTLTLGFIRPQSSDDWTLAYCQAELYVEYLLSMYGEDAIVKLLAAYSDRLTTAEALQKCFGVSQPDFEAGYRRHVDSIITAAKDVVPPSKPMLAELQRRAEAESTNAVAAAELALAWLDRDDKPAARRWALAAKNIDERQPLAAYVLARLQLAIGDEAGAVKLLDDSLDRNSPQEEVLALLAALKLKAGDVKAAKELYTLGDDRFPASDRWMKGLVRIFLQVNDGKRLAPLLRRWSQREPDNASIQKKLAQLAIAETDFAAAVKSATTAMHLDVQDAEAHALLAAALAGQTRREAAAEEYRTAIQLDGDKPEWKTALGKLTNEPQTNNP